MHAPTSAALSVSALRRTRGPGSEGAAGPSVCAQLCLLCPPHGWGSAASFSVDREGASALLLAEADAKTKGTGGSPARVQGCDLRSERHL